MKKTCVIAGIVLIVLGVLALLLGGLFWYASMHTLDGSAGTFDSQRKMMFLAFAAGLVFLAAGIVLLVLSKRMG